jgi:regulation of enolase protein 1 (concanavalin A-like superfamily)
MQWFNEPPSWLEDGERITIHSAPGTDFWRVTAQNTIKENAHFYYEHWQGNFQAEVTISGAYTGIWDQAGLMLRANAQHWIKCSGEYFDGQQHACAVVTHTFSDWSIVELPIGNRELALRITRKGTTIAIYYSLDHQRYSLLRLAYLAPAEQVEVGLYCASPEGPGFQATYKGFQVRTL